MYHHFTGKPDLARIAITRTAEDLRAKAEAQLAIPGTAIERITTYLKREREVLNGCPIGRLTQDPEVMENPLLRAPVQQTLAWLPQRVAQVLAQGRDTGEFVAALDPEAVAATVVAVLQGGYVLARAAGHHWTGASGTRAARPRSPSRRSHCGFGRRHAPVAGDAVRALARLCRPCL